MYSLPRVRSLNAPCDAPVRRSKGLFWPSSLLSRARALVGLCFLLAQLTGCATCHLHSNQHTNGAK